MAGLEAQLAGLEAEVEAGYDGLGGRAPRQCQRPPPTTPMPEAAARRPGAATPAAAATQRPGAARDDDDEHSEEDDDPDGDERSGDDEDEFGAPQNNPHEELMDMLVDTCVDRTQAPSNARKKPKNAYFLFAEEARPQIVKAWAEAGNGMTTGGRSGKLTALSKEVSSRWRALSKEDQQPYHERARELKCNAPPVRAAQTPKPKLGERLGDAATKGIAKVHRLGGTIAQARRIAANQAKEAVTLLRRGKNYVREHYFVPPRGGMKACWGRLCVLFAMLTKASGGLEKRTCMLLECLRRSILPAKGHYPRPLSLSDRKSVV